MIGRLLTAVLLSGVLAGVLISVVHEFTTTPIILHAELYEGGGGEADHATLIWTDEVAGGQFYLVHGDEVHEDGEEAWGPQDGFERSLFTLLSNVITGVAYAALLVAAFYLRGREVDGRTGLMWGVAGFVVFALAPGMGLPPEVPGAMASEIGGRQTWWAFAAAGTAAGLWLLLLVKKLPFNVLGFVLLVLPHVVGAPQPAELGGPVPPELSAHFASASLGAGLVFWALLGWIAGLSYERFVTRASTA
ncbi:MAG: hypothetical protein CMM46_15065 [Rhodospirillaceae bacterium]|nr:hypothetical protein [Rhodospirillaceae bacterium]|tara:strand:+ start:13305 stop:14048 length:744 start_codon:yes stop_codon:yes gene_type:complete